MVLTIPKTKCTQEFHLHRQIKNEIRTQKIDTQIFVRENLMYGPFKNKIDVR